MIPCAIRLDSYRKLIGVFRSRDADLDVRIGKGLFLKCAKGLHPGKVVSSRWGVD